MKVADLLSNQFIRIVLMVFFFLFVSKIVFALGIFLGVDAIIMSMYMCWITMIVLFGSLLPLQKFNFTAKSSSNQIVWDASDTSAKPT